ncbi:hypothetical protein VP01_3751g3 [Puccinia sorghi]|uniref:Uncharacterized protein n=1 Tax=Puccinia sorghi TaxID=27349 RepID=A0A0L6UVR7_9BASI|nr:hypothetical protein VP01_3751g3 [Puccinia sorghi]
MTSISLRHSITVDVSKYLGELEIRVKSYKDNVMAVHATKHYDLIRVEHAQGCRE